MKYHWEWELDAPRESLWRYAADTDWINRHAGLPPISARNEGLPDGGTRRVAWFYKGPIRVEWEERPTLWSAPEYYCVERRYRSGPLRLFASRTAFEALAGGRTRVLVDVEMIARNAFWSMLLPLVAAQGRAGADRAFKLAAQLAIADDVQRPKPAPDGALRPLLDRGVDRDAVNALERFLAESDERELASFRPYEIADRYGSSRKSLLRACLHATRAGLFNLRWDVICPSCRGTPNSFETLSALNDNLHCPSCNLPYGPQFDRSVEVTFNARPLGRGTDVPLYCIASPQRSAHVLAQTLLASGGSATLEVPLEAGNYDVNAIGAGIAPFAASPDDAVMEARAIVEERAIHAPHATGSGNVRFAFENASGREMIVRIETGRWPDTIATAAQVSAMQEFRDLFSSEVLAPGLELGIESLAVLFTDLVGSTAMYSRAGDAPAFKIVSDHFERMRAVISEHDGAIVKTIGDAVMAVFVDPLAALRTAIRLDASVADLHHDGVPLRLRVGFHVGPCIAMRANDRNDYFGTTVNLAARLQSVAGAGEVTFPRHLLERAAFAQIVEETGRPTFEQVTLKGIPQPVEVARLLTRG